MTYNVDRLRARVPALTEGAAHFDGPGGTQVPADVADAIAAALRAAVSNRGRGTAAERRADDIVTGARQAMADLLGADPRGIVFGRSMTQLTMDIARTLAQDWGPGDEVVVSRLDHDADVRPWVIHAERAGATIRWAEFDPATGEMSPQDVLRHVGPATRLVALTGASNLIGTRPDLAAVAAVVHEHDALFYVDGVHLTAHAPVDVEAIGCDFYACSPYKFLGPHLGVLAASPELLETLHPDKLLPATNVVPERFELGTLPYELLAGVTAAVDVLADLVPSEGTRRERVLTSMGALEDYEDALHARMREGLEDIPGITLYSNAKHRTPTETFTIDGFDGEAISAFLAERGVNAPAGNFYALEVSRSLGLGDTGGVRVGLAPYSSIDDVERLIAGLRALTS
ncbi:MAG: cysteine desulfurase-like protein [Candidatus Nanopelagicales bacterium]|jgi:cysteine desulfurase family protein (TIGR01976 family)